MFSLANAYLREYENRKEDSSIYGFIVNYSNGKKHNLAVLLNNNVTNCEERLVEQRKVSKVYALLVFLFLNT